MSESNNYTQIHIQLIFAVKYRDALIEKSWCERLHQYITGMIQANRHKVLQINSMPDHIHILLGLRPYQSISALVQNIKTESSIWIKENAFCKVPFAWQSGFGAFSYAKSQVPQVVRYIQNQESHHKNISFLDEYRAFLNAFELDYKEEYIFKEPV